MSIDRPKANEVSQTLVKSLGDFDVVVVGGGLAGGVAAARLAQSGLSVALFEKEKDAHHKVCGEFLSGEGLPFLKDIGIDVFKLGGVPVRGFRLHGPKNSGESQLPFPAAGLSRRRLDEELLKVATAAGVLVFSGTMVKELTELSTSSVQASELEKNGPLQFQIETSLGSARARRVIVATGKSEFKALKKRVGRDSGLVGFKMHLQLKPSVSAQLADNCDLFVFKHGYGGLSHVEDGIANFCFLIEREALKSIGTSWTDLADHISQNNWEASHYLDGAKPLFRQFVTVAQIPYGFVRQGKASPGVFCVGDQMAVIPSLTGDGMTIALLTGTRAAQAIIDSEKPGCMRATESSLVYQVQMQKLLAPQVAMGFYIHRLFRSPRLIDLAAPALGKAPFIFRHLFNWTRCLTRDENSVRQLLRKKQPALRGSTSGHNT